MAVFSGVRYVKTDFETLRRYLACFGAVNSTTFVQYAFKYDF